MSVKLTDEEGGALMAAIVAHSPYRRSLLPMLPRITRIALANNQIRAALAAVSERSSFGATGVLAKRDLGPERPTLMAFLEYIYFASPSFLSSVGEADLGGSNDGR
tara:strand:- start:225 stop:542 length:318 start_codon:yes stop_codon:yes gene_type:complete